MPKNGVWAWLKMNVSLQTFDQFENEGCDNCEPFLNLKHNRDNVYDCTSSNFDGWDANYMLTLLEISNYFLLRMMATCKPEESWVCKWQVGLYYFWRNNYCITVWLCYCICFVAHQPLQARSVRHLGVGQVARRSHPRHARIEHHSQKQRHQQEIELRKDLW